jgi:para-nitrobenzyl esterase
VPTTAKTTSGVLRGGIEDGLTVFRGVRYATCERFGPPTPVPAWSGEVDATVDGPVAPQRPSRMEYLMGEQEHHEQAEDCLNLTIATPGVEGGARPVLVWFHGGAWVSGAANWKCYGGHRLAREGDVVVVNVGYRLGALGYLRSPGVSEGNLGLADQLAALRWVRDNIAAFGGDPHQVTVAGQSAGGHTVQCLLGMTASRGLFRRAIIQSPPAGLGLGSSAAAARRSAERFLGCLGSDPRTAPVSAILEAQAKVVDASVDRLKLRVAPVFTPVAGVGPLPDEARWEEEATGRAPDLDVIIGTTAREMSAFYANNPTLRRLRRVPALGPTAADALERAVGGALFTRPSLRLASRLSEAGARVWAYLFDYAAPASPFGAAHCIELPFLFGTAEAWSTAPMLTGADPRDLDVLGRRLRSAWLDFTRTGTPTADESWPRFTAENPTVHHWGR